MRLAIGSLPITGPRRAVALAFRDFPECPAWPQLVQRFDAEHMTAQLAAVLAGRSPFSVLAGEAAAYSPFLTELMRREQRQAKAQCLGPFTGARLHPERPFGAVLAAVEALALQMLADYQAVGVFETLLFLDEPGWSAAAPAPEELAEVRALIERLTAAGASVGVHCCGETRLADLLDLPFAIIAIDAARYLADFLSRPERLRERLSEGLRVGWGLIDTRAPHEQGSPEEILQRFRTAMADWDWELIRRQALWTASCGLGYVEPEEAEFITAQLIALDTLATTG